MGVLETIQNSYKDYAGWLWTEISHPHWGNFFYWVVGLSLFFFLLEIARPWRKDQPIIRKDFWMDLFYIFFNFFLFSLVFWKAAQDVLVNLFNDFLAWMGMENVVMLQLDQLPTWAYFLILFIIGDFLSWWVHRMLHRVNFMWQWHKVHHSVEQMGFAAHVRFHWMESVIYWSFRYIPLTMLGADLVNIFALHVFTTAWGHFNHANISVHPRVTGTVLGGLIGAGITVLYVEGWLMGTAVIAGSAALGGLVLGPFMRYIFNSPEMHIWHHSKELPDSHRYGVNFGITLAIWDYIFGTAWVPHNGRDIELGFPDVESFPDGFLGQISYGFLPDSGKEIKTF